MNEARIICLLFLILFQPPFTRADCRVTRSFEKEPVYNVKCTLTNLHMDVSLTTYMPSYAKEATRMRVIDFRSSTISTVPVGVLRAFNQVEVLEMRNISLNSIAPGALGGMIQLQELYLDENNISEIQDGTFDGLVQLTDLHMRRNKLTKLKSLNGLTNLERLYLGGNSIEAIDDGALKDTVKLEYLNLSDNKLVNLRATLFSTMSQLREVYLQNNLINNIQTGLFNTTKLLASLLLFNNEIPSVPCSELSGIVILRSNRITSLANCSKKISYFDGSSNDLSSLPAMLFDQPSLLTELRLEYNNISRIHADAFIELHNLKTLTLYKNRITNIPLGTFRHLTHLTKVDISFNNLSYFEFGIFSGLTSLEVLDVSYNKIAMLKSKVLFPLKSLTELNLEGNLLQNFDAETMASHLKTLKSIYLNSNLIQCEWLTTCIHVFAIRNITVVSGYLFKTNNVNGIYCVGDNEQQNTTTPSVVKAKVTQPLLPTTKQDMEILKNIVNMLLKTTEAFRAEYEKFNDDYVQFLRANSNTHYLLVFMTGAVLILIIIKLAILLFNMYSIKRINMENTRKSPSCAVELLNVTD